MGMGGIPIQRLDAAESDRVLEKAVDAGISFFDTARGYTDSESKFGRVLPRYRDRVLIASKSFSRGAAEIMLDIETSLRLLRTDYIDMYQCHNMASEADLEKILAADGALAGMAQGQGSRARSAISAYRGTSRASWPWRWSASPSRPSRSRPISWRPRPCADLIPAARRRGVGVIAMKPVGGGNIREIALNFRFIFNQGVDVAIPGMDAEAQVVENVAALADLSPLDGAETARLQKEKERLGDSFCRRCEYCMPCPQGLPISFLHVLRNYYFLYDLKDWVLERMSGLAKTYKDCVACGECVAKCPYHLDMPDIFRETWEKMQADKGAGPPK